MQRSQRWVIHVDLDAFFASVEELLNPELRGKPIIVGGSPRHRGVVSSASYAARAYGVRSAMPTAQALRLCPRAIVVRPRHKEYARRSQGVMAILRGITPVMEQVSIDEAFLDVTGCELLWGPVEEIARLIQRRVVEEERLPVSLGVASSKLVAKIACDLGKPGGLVIVQVGEERSFLAPLAIDRLWGVGEVTAARLRDLDIATIGDLADWSEEQLVRAFGDAGKGLYSAARGIDRSVVHVSRHRHSISHELTFDRDTADSEVIRRTLLSMSENVASRLRGRRLVAQTVRIKLRDPGFTTMTRQTTIEHPTDQPLVIFHTAEQLLRRNWRAGRALRLLGVGVSSLLKQGGYQLSLFDRADQRRIRLSRAVDAIRDRYGDEAITRASLLGHQRHADAREQEPDS